MWSWLSCQVRRQESQEEAWAKLDRLLTMEKLTEIIQAYGKCLEESDGSGGYGREKDLPYPKDLIDVALLKAIAVFREEKLVEALWKARAVVGFQRLAG